MQSVLFIVAGVGLLYLGGELLVRFASSLALRLGLSPLVIGLTVVAFGTSAPEFAATLTAALSGSAAIGAGNVIGSNTANVGLILGLCALLLPLGIDKSSLVRELPVMIAASALPVFWFIDGVMSRGEGAVMIALLLSYLIWTLRSSKKDSSTLEDVPGSSPLWLTFVGIVGGLALLVLGAQVLVAGATTLARAFGISEKVIGLTLVAVGTSLPELASSLVAITKRQTDMVLGNIIGSNIFNMFGILGLASVIVPLHLPFRSLNVDLYTMLAFGLLTYFFLFTRKKLVRWEGVVLLGAYALYVGWLF